MSSGMGNIAQTHTEIKIVEIHLASSHNRTRRNNDRRSWASCLDLWQQEFHKQEVGDIIDAKLHLKAILGFVERACHHTSHEDYMVDLGHICEAPFNCLADATQIRQFDVEEASFDIGLGLLDLFDDRSYL